MVDKKGDKYILVGRTLKKMVCQKNKKRVQFSTRFLYMFSF